MKPGFLIGALTLALATSALAGPVEDGLAARARGDYHTAMELLELAADRGDPRAEVAVGDRERARGDQADAQPPLAP